MYPLTPDSHWCKFVDRHHHSTTFPFRASAPRTLLIPPHSKKVMFSKAIRAGRAAPIKRCSNFVSVSRRAVTTDAASSHAEKSDVPAVSHTRKSTAMSPRIVSLPIVRCRRMISHSRSGYRTRVSKPTSLTLLRTPWIRPRRSSSGCILT